MYEGKSFKEEFFYLGVVGVFVYEEIFLLLLNSLKNESRKSDENFQFWDRIFSKFKLRYSLQILSLI